MLFNDFNVSKGRLFLFGCLSFVAGIALASFLPPHWLAYRLYWFCAGIFFLILTILIEIKEFQLENLL